jgi:fucose 4-O-acetylase-like acetyltransferase
VSSPKPDRLLFVDNLRWLMIILVVSMHAAVTFSGLGSWYYVEKVKLDAGSLLAFAFYQTHLQAFFMGFLFLIAGYFVPGACARKGARKFIADRAVRLGVPTLIYVLLVQPAVAYYLCHAPGSGPFPSLWTVCRHYFLSLRFLGGTGPMWFALALLIFCVFYPGVGRLLGDREAGQRDAPLPGHAAVAGLIGLITVGAFLIRVVQPIGTSILNMQLCFFTQYVVLFAVGTIAWQRNWLARLPHDFGVFWLRLAVVVGPLLWVGMMLAGGGGTGEFDPYTGGWHWQSAAYCVWESFFCVAVCLGLLVVFRDRFNAQGRFARFLSDNAFAVYVFHPPILIAITFALRGPGLAPLSKFVLASVVATIVCFLAAHYVFRRIPGLRRVL